MDDDLQPGDEAPDTSTEDTGASLADTVAEEFGFGGDTAGDTATPPSADDATTTTTALATEEGAQPADPAAAAPTAEAKPDPNAELYAPLPEHNPRKTHERFQRLVEGHKEEVTKREAAETERDQFKGQIEQYEAGLEPLREMGFNTPDAVQDLQQFSQYRKALQSGNVDTAMGILQAQLNQLALASGRRVEVNPLSAFPELAEAVRVGELSEATAMELARGRHGQQVQQQHHQQRQQQEQQHSQQMQAIGEGRQAVEAAVRELQGDIDFPAVLPALQAQLAHIKATYAPHQWAGEIKRTYQYEKRLLAAQQRPATPNRQPLRGNGHQGGMPAPTNSADAAMQALGLDL